MIAGGRALIRPASRRSVARPSAVGATTVHRCRRSQSSAPQPFASDIAPDDEDDFGGSSDRTVVAEPAAAATAANGSRERLRRLRERLAEEDRHGKMATMATITRTRSASPSATGAPRAGGPSPERREALGKKAEEAEASEPEESWQTLLKQARSTFSSPLAPFPGDPTQEMLSDSYSRHHTYLRISLSERCNLRCRYCMPPEGVPLQEESELLSDEEIVTLVGLFVEGGVDKVRLTGGEPLLRPTLPHLIESISSRHPTIRSVGITTNGLTLSRSLPTLLDAGLTHANISLDTLRDDRFVEITRRKGLGKVMRSIEDSVEMFGERYGRGHGSDDAAAAGRVKINCVVMRGFNDDELRDFVMLTERMSVDVRFIEWMPFNDNGWNSGRFIGYRDMMARIRGDDVGDSGDEGRAEAMVEDGGGGRSWIGPLHLERLEDGPNDTTKWWRVPGHVGRVGFITSMSSNFCSTCNRLRITADGQLKVCLFGSREVSLRDAMRAGTDRESLALLVKAAVGRKTFALGGHGTAEGIARANDNRPMTLIGG